MAKTVAKAATHKQSPRRKAPVKRKQHWAKKVTAGARVQAPLRRRILAALAEGAATPTQLGARFGSPTPPIIRLLKECLEQGWVVKEGDAGDRRRRHYSLTPTGEAALNGMVASGPKQRPPAPLSDEQGRRLVRSGLDRAVRIRREENRLGEAASRLRAVVREAEKAGTWDVALEGMVELAKTLRQDRQADEKDGLDAEYGDLIDRLNRIALGGDDHYGADLALPAAAHLKYTLGRAGDRLDDDLPTREGHLIAACSLYGQLVLNSEGAAASSWFERRAWSIISLAGNLRKQTRLERALWLATAAKRDFDTLDDDYGRAHCLFMFGLCLRLLGEFNEAAVCLEQAHRLATTHSFERVAADSLMQMGEVKRSLGELDESREMLGDALDRAGRMEMWVTRAFAQSALGAVAFQGERYPEAQDHFDRAGELFGGCGHDEGMTLNTRRQVAAARRAALVGSSRPSYAAIKRLIESAQRGYLALHSPAGVVACEIEEGWVRMLRKGGRVGPVVERLKRHLADYGQRDFLELDPWVPHVLKEFAWKVEDEELVRESEAVATAAQAKLSERGSRGVEQVAEVVREVKLVEERELDTSTAEMGGEARRDPCSFERLLVQGRSEEELAAVAA
jgi:DNA-binding MarR family transcriptional regulator